MNRVDAAADGIAGSVGDSVAGVANTVHQQVGPWVRRLTQSGWIAKGIVYGSIAWAMLDLAADNRSDSGTDVEYTGFVAALADGTITRILLFLIAGGLLVYISFRLLSVALIDDVDADAWAHRIGYTFSAATYAAIAWAAGTAAVRGPTPEGESRVEAISSALVENPVGRILVGLGGLGAIGVAGYFLYKGVTRRFMSQVASEDLSDRHRRLIEYTGAIGWVGRSGIVAVVAAFVTWSAIDADPNDARGLDSSMYRITSETAGQVLVWVIGVMLAVYAVYCVLSAPYRCLAWDDNPEPHETPNLQSSEPQPSSPIDANEDRS